MNLPAECVILDAERVKTGVFVNLFQVNFILEKHIFRYEAGKIINYPHGD